MPSVQISSEIGTLRSVLVHEPGNEVLAVTPGTRKDFLYEDIIELDIARSEHRTMVAVLERFADVCHARSIPCIWPVSPRQQGEPSISLPSFLSK